MKDEVEICNYALGRLAVATISNLEGTQQREKSCARAYEASRLELLMDPQMLWSFSITRKTLAAVEDENLTTFGYAYRLPLSPALLRPICLLDVDGGYADLPKERFEIEGVNIYCDRSPAAIKYVRDETVVARMPEDFKLALALRVATVLAIELVQKTGLYDRLIVEFNAVKGAAIMNHARSFKAHTENGVSGLIHNGTDPSSPAYGR